MPREIDEDLIEATIRKVREAQAAREDDEPAVEGQPVAAEDEAPSARQPADEGLIEATIRRVREAQAARGNDEPAVEAQSVAREDDEPAVEAQPVAAEDDAPPARQPVDEDLIEATIRRVAAQKAAKLAGDPDWEHVQAPPLEQLQIEPEPEAIAFDEDEALAERPAPSVRAFAGAEWEHRAITAHAEEDADMTEAAAELDEAPPSHDRWQPDAAPLTAARAHHAPQSDTADAIERIERMLAALVDRVDAIVPIIEGLVGSAESEWGAGAPLPRIGPSTLVRSVLRDPSPRTATAEHLEPEIIDTRPIPKPLPPIETKRSFDLLPRTYRITVEDKRRGVDLVPLHRALLGIDGVRDMSLLSYNNGIAIVSLEATTDIEPEVVRQSVARAMAREARIETNNEQAMVVKLAED